MLGLPTLPFIRQCHRRALSYFTMGLLLCGIASAQAIRGTVTAPGGTPVGSAVVVAFTSPTEVAAVVFTGSNGAFALNVPAGSYFIRAGKYPLIEELHPDIGCTTSGCNFAAATPVVFDGVTAVTGINFALIARGSISGAVTRSGSGAAVGVGSVSAVTAPDLLSADTVLLAANGTYTLRPLPGVVKVVTANRAQLIDEAFDNLPCPFLGCALGGATSFNVASGESIGAVNFALAPGGAISGTMTRASDGMPVELGGIVSLFDATGTLLDQADVTGGNWVTGAGLPSGNYRVAGIPFGSYPSEVWDNEPCAAQGDCDPLIGDLIAVTAPNTVAGINFVVARSTGALLGRVTELATGQALAGVEVQIARVSDGSVISTATDGEGNWSNSELEPGTYTVRAVSPNATLLDELFPNVQCIGVLCAGTAQNLIVAAGQDVTGIDFALAPAATLEVGLRNSVTGQLMSGQVIARVPGREEAVGGLAPAAGVARLLVISGGAVRFAGTASACGAAGNTPCLGERFPDDPCPSLSCNLFEGVTLNVPKGATVTGELLLGTGASIAGRVTSTSGAPLANVLVTIQDANDVQFGGAFTDVDGIYRAAGLAPGSHFARTASSAGFLDELYDNRPCPNGSCQVASGTPIVVGAGQSVNGVNFALAPGGTIGGTVRNEFGEPLPGALVTIFNDAGQAVVAVDSDGNGVYVSSALVSGSYRVRFDASGRESRLYDNVSCSASSCDPLSGSPVLVAAPSATVGINATLPASGATRPVKLVYLNSCRPGGCTVISGMESSINNTSSIISGTRTLSPWSFGDATFDALVTCVRAVMAPYHIAVMTAEPGNVPHREAMVGGTPNQLGFSNEVGGVAPWLCGAGIDNSISFTFAQLYGPNVPEICHTVAHEVGHQFGLDHEFLAPDPMTYLNFDGSRRFQDVLADCGELAGPHACDCSNRQNSHVHLANRVGLNPLVFSDSFEFTAAARALATSSIASGSKRAGNPIPLQCGTDTRKQGWRPTAPRLLDPR